jgi:malonate transporter MadL subunit
MIIYGVAILAFCFVAGQLVGEALGQLMGINANVGGVGFAMLLLIVLHDLFIKKEVLDNQTKRGIQFWSQMYIPIVVAMSAIQNVKLAVFSGAMALAAGIVPVLLSIATIPLLAKLTKPKHLHQDGSHYPVS